jgi:hypothetical protein
MDWDWPADQGRRIKGGKTLGGSTSINGGEYVLRYNKRAPYSPSQSNLGAYTRGLAAQYDAWSSLLSAGEQNLGWNWASLFSYMKKVNIP